MLRGPGAASLFTRALATVIAKAADEVPLADLNRLRASGQSDMRAAGKTGLSAASKIELFRDLFRGRQDVFAVRWENRAKGRSGYSPRCGNEWKPGVCHKPKVRCGSCTNQAFASLGDRDSTAEAGRGDSTAR